MDWNALVIDIFRVCLIPLFGIITAYLTNFLKAKKAEIEDKVENEKLATYLQMLDDTIINCVISTNQTYVESLKQSGTFNLEAQKEAFKLTYDAVIAIIGKDAEAYLALALGDLYTYITNKIEAEVSLNK